MGSPSSIRFDERVLRRVSEFVARHPGMSLSGASNLLVDEALRSREHPLVTFRDGPGGRRARLVGGPDVWEVLTAIRSARKAEPRLSADEVVALVSDTSGVPTVLVRAAIEYWSDYPDEIDTFIERAMAEAEQARKRWEREQGLFSR